MSKSKEVEMEFKANYNDYTWQKDTLSEDYFKNPKVKSKSEVKRVLSSILHDIKNNKRFIFKYFIKCVLYIPLFIFLSYCFVWVHEFGHVFASLFMGNGVEKVEVYGLFGGGKCFFKLNDYSNPLIPYFMMAGGSLLVLSISIFLLVYSFIKLKLWLIFIAIVQILKEFRYWAISPGIEWGDAYLLIEWAEHFEQKDVIEMVLSIETLFPIIFTIIMIISIIFVWRYITHLNNKAVNYAKRLKMKKAIKREKKIKDRDGQIVINNTWVLFSSRKDVKENRRNYLEMLVKTDYFDNLIKKVFGE